MTQEIITFFETLNDNAGIVAVIAVLFRIWNPKILFYDAAIILTINIFLICNAILGDYWAAAFDCLLAALWIGVYKIKKEKLEKSNTSKIKSI